MAVLKNELQIGDVLIANIESNKEYVEVNKLELNAPHDSNNIVDTPFVGVKVLETGDLVSVHQSELIPIQVTADTLNTLGFKSHTKDNIPFWYLENKVVLSRISISLENKEYYTSPLSLVENWDDLLESPALFKEELMDGHKEFVTKFPPMNELHTLLKHLKKNGFEFDIEDILESLKSTQ